MNQRIPGIREWLPRVRNISEKDILLSRGFHFMDFHVHTFYSYDVIPCRNTDPLVLYERARAQGCKYVTFTDHDTMGAYERIGWTREGIVPGVEVKILDEKNVGHTIHVNVYELNQKQFAEIQKITRGSGKVELMVQYLRENRLPYVLNHPFWHELNEEIHVQALLDIAHLFPVLEYNMGRVRELNQLAVELARKNNAAILAGSDTHIGNIGNALTFSRGETFREFFDNIREKRAGVIPRSMDMTLFAREVMERVRYIFKEEDLDLPNHEFEMDTGIRSLDNFVRTIRNSSHRRFSSVLYYFLGNLFRVLLASRVPGYLYMQGQRKLAARVQSALVRYFTSAELHHLYGSLTE